MLYFNGVDMYLVAVISSYKTPSYLSLVSYRNVMDQGDSPYHWEVMENSWIKFHEPNLVKIYAASVKFR